MTGYFSWAIYERLRSGYLGNLDDRMEAEWAAHREAKARDGGHGDCEGWQFIPEDARLICSCGEVIATEGKWGGPGE
jgi:hypothetical protein